MFTQEVIDLILANAPVRSLTTSGSSGAATLSGGVLNVPQYTGSGGTSQWDDITGGINYAGGKVGVGTTTPASALHVQNIQNAATTIRVTNTNTGSTAKAEIIAERDNGFTTAFGVASVTATPYGILLPSEGYIYNNTSGLNFIVDNEIGITRFGGQGAVEFMRINSIGSIGIGDASPNTAAVLHVSGIRNTSDIKGVLLAPMTIAQRDSIAGTKPAGLEIYCTDATATDSSTGVKQVWNGSAWKNCW